MVQSIRAWLFSIYLLKPKTGKLSLDMTTNYFGFQPWAMVWEFHQSLNNLYSAEPAVLALSYHIGHLSHCQARPAYRIGSRMIIYLTDEDSDGMKSQFFHPSDNHLSTWCFTDQRLYEAFYNYLCGALFIQSIVRMIKNIIVHLMIFFIICVYGGVHYKYFIL